MRLEYYAKRTGFSHEEAGVTPFGELCDMIACYQIEHGAKEKPKTKKYVNMVPDIR